MLTDISAGWEKGVRTYYCLAAAFDADGNSADVTGSFTEEWEEAPEQVDA